MEVVFIVLMFVVGAICGSFACCQAWRLHLAEKPKDRKAARLRGSKWSVCMDCGSRLKWYDNLPVVSWLMLRGKCRKCGKKIGGWEIASELGLAVVFAAVGMKFWLGYDVAMGGWEAGRYWGLFGLLLVMLVGLAILFVADARWGRLPTKTLTFCIICAIVYVFSREWGVFSVAQFWNYLGALVVLPVLYFLLYKVSEERWVGSGDWLLALPLALVLGNFWLAFFCLFVANLLGCLVMVPLTARQGKGMNVRVPFGPFLIAAFVVVFLGQGWILGLL